MVININSAECEKILKNYAFISFRKILGCGTADDMDIDIKYNYSSIKEMEITKKIKKEENETGKFRVKGGEICLK